MDEKIINVKLGEIANKINAKKKLKETAPHGLHESYKAQEEFYKVIKEEKQKPMSGVARTIFLKKDT